jgi:hypothetical protein
VCTLNPAQTIIIAPDDVPWRVPDIAPPRSVAEADAGGVKFIRGVRIPMSISNPGPVDDHAGRSRVRALLIVRGGHADDASLATYNAYPQTLSGGANEAMT